ncbi:MAG: tyrosine-type recombinase/integrase [Acidimicrobiales bacterium]
MATVERWDGDRWRARWRDPSGRTLSKVFARKGDAQRHLTAVEHSLLVGGYVDRAAGRTTVAEYWQAWAGRQPWRESSRRMVASYFATHVEPRLGARPLNSLRRGDLESWAASLPVAARTARQIMQYVSTMLDAAVADRLLASNPARGAKRPRVECVPVVPFTGAEVEMLRLAAPDWFAVALTLGLGAGLRHGETSGLTVDRIDFLRRQLTVDRQLLSPLAGEPAFGPLKTRRSYRTVPLADAVLEDLARRLERHGTGRDGLVVHAPDGSALRRHRFGDIWRRLRGQAGMPAARFHDTRHTYASTLLSGGVSVAAAGEYLGDSPAVLLATYAHLLPADHDRARAVVEAAFSPTSRVMAVSRPAPATG